MSDAVDAPVDVATQMRALAQELDAVCADPWVVIGSAAARLLGAEVSVADIDVLTSRRDAMALQARWTPYLAIGYVPPDGQRFRSQHARYDFSPRSVEVMGDLALREASGWQQLHVLATTRVDLDGVAVPMPARDELVRILEWFGREKDHQRATLLRALSRKHA